MTAQILVVDDEPHFELIVRKAFRRQERSGEYQFAFALNGVEALKKIGENPNFDMVLSDINMPEMDGLTLLRHINEAYPLLRTVVVTAYADMNNIRTAMNSGAFDFLVKPISLDDLQKTIVKTLAHTAQLRELDRARKEKERSRRELVEHLQKMDRLKDEFLANVSHELKTPLNGIIGITESLVDGAAGPVTPEIRENLFMVTSSGRRLSALVHDLLDFSKLKNSDLHLDARPLSVGPVIQAVLSLCRPLLSGKDLQLVNQVPHDVARVLADENRLEQILYNLVGNAIKFTDLGQVAVSAEVLDDKLAVGVTDSGIGIPLDKQDLIFNSFEQLDGSQTRKYGGTGLGLTISRKLVRLHGGELSVSSAPGQGSTFTFTLPLCDQAQIEPDLKPIPENNRIITWDASPEVIPVSGNLSLHAGARILAADDEAVNLKVLANHFSLQQYEVVTVTNGYDALKALEEKEFDLLLLDLMMPGMSGYEVCRQVRETRTIFELPILVLTARNQPRDFLAALECGANDYLPKPFDKRELIARAQTLLTLKQAVREAMMHVRHLEAERQNRQMSENLRNLMERLTSTLNLSEVLSRFMDHIAEAISFDRGLIAMLADKQLELSLERGFAGGVDAPALASLTNLFFKETIQFGRPQTLVTAVEPPLAPALEGQPGSSWLLIPFFTHGEASGLLALERQTSQGFLEKEIELIHTFAGQAAIAFENASLFGKVKLLATTDELTGLNNRRNFFSLGKVEFQRATRYQNYLAVIMLDIDHFKKFNDTYGHAVGDQVLTGAARRIFNTCRDTDIVGRYGGEEFAVIMPNTDQTTAFEAAERIRLAVGGTAIETSQGPLNVTISLGVAIFDKSQKNLEEVFKLADLALYKAKETGRNRVVIHPQPSVV